MAKRKDDHVYRIYLVPVSEAQKYEFLCDIFGVPFIERFAGSVQKSGI